MQEETTEKTISLCIKGAKVTEGVLKAVLKKLVSEMNQQKSSIRRCSSVTRRGKQSLKQMMKEGSQLTNIEITDNNIKSFERVARKYGIDYSLKKDSSTSPPRYRHHRPAPRAAGAPPHRDPASPAATAARRAPPPIRNVAAGRPTPPPLGSGPVRSRAGSPGNPRPH